MRRWIPVWALLVGCAAHKSASSGGYAQAPYDAYGGEAAYYEEAEMDYGRAVSMVDEAPAPKRAGGRAPMSPPPPPPPAPPPGQPASGFAPAEPEPERVEQAAPAAQRMIHYDGYARIRTPRAEELVEGVIAVATEAGGHVESRSVSRVTVRVPVDGFDATWKKVLALGPVVARHLGADDVTDAFTDMDLRVTSLQATRDRLAVLLAKATTEEEKLALLQQIHRLSEQIEVIEAQLAALRDLASLSRISVEAEAPALHANAASALPHGMGWIDGLSAFDHSIATTGRPVRLEPPQGFVRLDPKRYHVQAADGAVVWAGTLTNDPVGDGEFWRAAVVDRFGEQLDDGSLSEVGGWSMVRFTEPGAEEPYVWYLGFRPDGKHLEVLQLYYPDPEQETRYHDGVLAALKGGAA